MLSRSNDNSPQGTHRKVKKVNIMEAITNKMVTTFHTEGRTFHIVFNEESAMYLAIEDKYVTDGKLNCKLNGLQMKANKTLEGCLDQVEFECKVEKLVASGMDIMEAFKRLVVVA